jgi:hypothetical protein
MGRGRAMNGERRDIYIMLIYRTQTSEVLNSRCIHRTAITIFPQQT